MNKSIEVIKGKVKFLSDKETKKSVVRELQESGLSLNQFAKERGMSPATLCNWRKKYQLADINSSINDSEHSEQMIINALKAENESLRNEIFKMKAFIGHKLYQIESQNLQ